MIDGSVVGGTEVVRRFSAMPDSLRVELRKTVARLTATLTNKVKSKLDGEVLQRRTGLLRRSINSAIEEAGDIISGIVSSAVAYARPHEYGFDGVVSVRAHLRTIKEAFGRSITPVTFEVRSHSMHMHLPERSFLRSSLEQMRAAGTIADEMAGAVKRATS